MSDASQSAAPAVRTVAERVTEIFCEETEARPEEVARDTRLDHVTDSLGAVEFVMAVEDEFEVSIPDEEARKIETLGQAIEWVERAVGAQHQP